MSRARSVKVEIHSGPDGFGRYFYTATWIEDGGVYRPELGKDGKPVGYRRGQCFNAAPPDAGGPFTKAFNAALNRRS